MAEIAPRTIEVAAKGGRPTTKYVLRSCREEDAPLFEPFWRVVITESNHTLQTSEHPPDFTKLAEKWGRTRADPFDVRLGAFEGERIIGQIGMYGDVTGHPWTKHRATFGMIVLGEFWGRGVARTLLQSMEAHARSVGVLKIEADVRVENERGVRFYQSAGYAIVGTRTRAVKIDGRFRDEYFIAKDLDRG